MPPLPTRPAPGPRRPIGAATALPVLPALVALLLALPGPGAPNLGLPGVSALPLAAQDTSGHGAHGAHGPATGASSEDDPSDEPTLTGLSLYPALGDYARPVTTANDEARRYFVQGILLTYGFAHGEGIRSFREARAHDPTCAPCAWGEAWAMGPHINGRMQAAAIEGAWAALTRARELVAENPDRASPVERALIEALAERYAPTAEALEAAGGRATLDSAYARAMEGVAERFPDDLEVLTLLGEAHMVLRPWDYWDDAGNPQPGLDRALEVLESALARDLAHPGACHLYIHLVEASPAPERAEPCAELLEDRIPGVSHIPHMPSHIWMRIGRYGDAVRGNQRAWVADQRAAFDGAPGVYTSHNLHMLAFAASFDGQGAVAMQAARDLAGIAVGSSFYIPLTLVRFGRWDEILALPAEESNDFRAGVLHFARGMARLRQDDALRAGIELETLDRLRERLPENARFRGHLQRDLLGMARGVLEGEILAAAGELDRAVAAMEAAVALEEGLSYDEPEPWTIPVRHHLGAILVEGERFAQALEVYEASLRIHPENGWALAGVARALEGLGDEAGAAEARRAFEGAWARADTWTDRSRF